MTGLAHAAHHDAAAAIENELHGAIEMRVERGDQVGDRARFDFEDFARLHDRCGRRCD
ncbi:hypothetical protein D3C83_293690 [compost metagenome]